MFPRLHTLAFEADEGALAEGAGAGAASAEDTGTDYDAGSEFDYQAPEFQQAVGYAVEDAMGRLLQQLAQSDPGDDEAELDPYNDPEGFRGYMQQAIDQSISRHMQQIEPTVHAFEDQQNQQLVEQWCEDEAAITEAQEMLGEERSASNTVQFMASGYLPDLEDRYGPGERATRTALRMAADQYRSDLKAAHDAGYQARTNELRGLSGARPPITPGSGPVEAVAIHEEPADELEAMARIMARREAG